MSIIIKISYDTREELRAIKELLQCSDDGIRYQTERGGHKRAITKDYELPKPPVRYYEVRH